MKTMSGPTRARSHLLAGLVIKISIRTWCVPGTNNSLALQEMRETLSLSLADTVGQASRHRRAAISTRRTAAQQDLSHDEQPTLNWLEITKVSTDPRRQRACALFTCTGNFGAWKSLGEFGTTSCHDAIMFWDVWRFYFMIPWDVYYWERLVVSTSSQNIMEMSLYELFYSRCA